MPPRTAFQGQSAIYPMLLCLVGVVALPAMRHLGDAQENTLVGAVDSRFATEPLRVSSSQLGATGWMRGAHAIGESVGKALRKVGSPVSYRALPSSPIDWSQSQFSKPVQQLWIPEAKRIEKRGGLPGALQAERSELLGEPMAALVEDLLTDIATTVGSDGLSYMRLDAKTPASLFSQAAAAALFAMEDKRFAPRELIAKAMKVTGSDPDIVALASRIEALADFQRRPPYSLDDARIFLNLPDETPTAILEVRVNELYDEVGLHKPVDDEQLANVFGGSAERFEPTFAGLQLPVLAEDHFTRWLPRAHSVDWNRLVETTRSNMKKDGYAIVPTGQFFPTGTIERMSADFRAVRAAKLHADRSSVRFRNPSLDRLKDQTIAALSPAALAYNRWQAELFSEVFGIDLRAGSAQLEFVRRSDAPLIGVRGNTPETQHKYFDAHHLDDVVIGSSSVFGKRSTRLYPDIDYARRDIQALGTQKTRVLEAESGDIVLIYGLKAAEHPDLADWSPVPTPHGSPAERDTRLWYGVSLTPN